VWLFGMDLEGDNDDYAEALGKAGYHTPQDLFSKSPSLEQLVKAGITDMEDAKKIRKAVMMGSARIQAAPAPAAPVGFVDLGIDGIDLSGPSATAPAAGVPALADQEFGRTGASLDDILQQYTALDAAVSVFDQKPFLAAKDQIERGNALGFRTAIEDMDVNMKDPADGNTLLHWAVALNRKEMVEYLLAKGVRQELNAMNKTPMELAVEAVQHGDSSYIPLRNYLWHALQKPNT